MPNGSMNEVTQHLVGDHLFISYAWEDQVFAKWLAMRLAAEGYKVWIDQIKLLGGESWPTDIDDAIKTRTFRMLGLLSKYSISKTNPVKERTLALNIGKQPGRMGFLIPLNVDGLSAVDLDWLSSDITFIQFSLSWANGLAQLLKLLEREGCPKTQVDGRALVTSVASARDLVSATPEQLVCNRARFSTVPAGLTVYRVEQSLRTEDGNLFDAGRDWSFYPVTPHRVVAFHPPPEDLASWLSVEVARNYQWQSTAEIEGISTRNIVLRLLRGCIETRLRRAGFAWSPTAKAFTFPGALGQTVRVLLPDGTSTTTKHSGERTYFRIGQPKQKYRYRLAVKLTMDEVVANQFRLIWSLRFHFIDLDGNLLPSIQQQSRRKHLTREWRNYHWLVRNLAAMQFCSDDDDLIRVGQDGEGQVVLDCRTELHTVPVCLDESKLVPQQEVSDEEADAQPVADDDVREPEVDSEEQANE